MAANSEPCDHSDWYPELAKQPCHCGRPGCTKTDTGTSCDTCPHWADDNPWLQNGRRAEREAIIAMIQERCEWLESLPEMAKHPKRGELKNTIAELQGLILTIQALDR